jgi:hypothetical protein
LNIILYCTLTLFVTLFFGELATKYKFGRWKLKRAKNENFN